MLCTYKILYFVNINIAIYPGDIGSGAGGRGYGMRTEWHEWHGWQWMAWVTWVTCVAWVAWVTWVAWVVWVWGIGGDVMLGVWWGGSESSEYWYAHPLVSGWSSVPAVPERTSDGLNITFTCNQL
jgi:hypothetical protein